MKKVMEKIRKYNQYLLASLGTLLLIGLAGMLLIGAIELLESLSYRWQRDNSGNDAVILEPAEKDTPSQRNQTLSFEQPLLIDSAKHYYLIPVTQFNLKNPEPLTEDKVSAERATQASYKEVRYNYYNYNQKRYNNLLFYKQQEAQKVPVFDLKVSLGRFSTYKANEKRYLLAQGATQDTNKDGLLNGQDLEAFFFYELGEQEAARRYQPEGQSLTDYQVLHETEKVVLRFRKDQDGDGTISDYQDPYLLYLLDLKSGQLTDLIDPELRKHLQSLLD